ncbi:MAG TPA: phage baseplate assembly protein V [Novosphingobium sp.]|nr:phage baseplate assembly protein V [Novosphingobium sp.]
MTVSRPIANMVGAGNVTGVDDSGETQRLQITEGAVGSGFMARVLDGVRRIFSFGFTSVPPLGSEVVMLRRGGQRVCSIIIGTNHRASRPTGLSPGDTAMYDVRGVILKFTAAGPVLDCAGLPLIIQNASKMTIDVPDVELTGNLTVAGDITGLNGSAALALSTIRSTFNAHGHTGVSTGSGTSGSANHSL